MEQRDWAKLLEEAGKQHFETWWGLLRLADQAREDQDPLRIYAMSVCCQHLGMYRQMDELLSILEKGDDPVRAEAARLTRASYAWVDSYRASPEQLKRIWESPGPFAKPRPETPDKQD